MPTYRVTAFDPDTSRVVEVTFEADSLTAACDKARQRGLIAATVSLADASQPPTSDDPPDRRTEGDT